MHSRLGQARHRATDVATAAAARAAAGATRKALHQSVRHWKAGRPAHCPPAARMPGTLTSTWRSLRQRQLPRQRATRIKPDSARPSNYSLARCAACECYTIAQVLHIRLLACPRRDPTPIDPRAPKCSASCRRPKLAPWRRPPREWVPRPQRSCLRPLLRPHPPPADPAPRHPLAAASQRMFAPSHRAVRVAAVAAVDPVGAAASKARPTARLAPAARACRCPTPRLARRPPPCRQTPPRCCCARCAASKWSAPPCG